MSLPELLSGQDNIIDGIAEIFGTELSNDIEYKFSGIKSAIYTHQGCKLEYSGQLTSEYISEETEMSAYISLHLALENLRNTSSKGPNVLILGAKDSGKSTLSKILSSYALRMDHQPFLVNLDPSKSGFSIPGSLSAAPISDILDVEQGLGQSYTTGPTLLHPKQPTVRYFGYDNFDDHLKFYKYNVSRLGITVLSRLQEDEKVRRSGLIVDTPPLTIKNVDLIQDIVSDFDIDILVVVGNERLFIDLKKRFKERLTVVKVPKSAGVVDIDDAYQRKLQQKAIKEYFHGIDKSPLSPYTVNVDFKVVNVFKPYIESTELISSVLPIGEEGFEDSKDDKSSKLIEHVETNSSNLLNSVVAILHADKNEDEDEIVRSSVLGFAVVTDVDDIKSFLRILIPVPGRLPDKAMILGSFRYIE
ncbi:hypothetical protein WICMUC_001396 [Wickerhamomyces mucosus]|uniref:Polynucleotide 5'-hydroxyl-kinase GRC3 n=1 Tax=Wickerhamomyces mucosus TaxID=1378264 RepID=A0A9P8TGX6_9ASCO|nr:hypothetical protein WICMUC_001396 [Wickerhamomyces mucosus]